MSQCATCGHAREEHPLRSCRVERCPCMRFVLDSDHYIPLEPIGWAGCALSGVVELIAGQTEGVVHVATSDGNECVVRVTFRPLARYNCAAVKGVQ